MKILVVLVLCIGGAMAWLSEQERYQLKRFSSQCANEIGISVSTIQQVLVGESKAGVRRFHCFVACMLKKAEIMNEYGVIDEDVVKDLVPIDVSSEEVENVIDDCRSRGPGDACDHAGHFLKCIVKTVATQALF